MLITDIYQQNYISQLPAIQFKDMLKNWGAWLGKENENDQVKEKRQRVGEKRRDDNPLVYDEEKQTYIAEKDAELSQLLQKTRSLCGSIFNFASKASKTLTESVVETAQGLRKSLEEGKLNEFIDKTILGDFQKEQDKFVLERQPKKIGLPVPPWVGYDEEDVIQEQILALSADKRNFLRNPPAGVQFHFDFEQTHPVALAMLEEDELLRKMRFHLVPKEMTEENFWRNYFYRVSLIKQSAQLTTLTAQQDSECLDSDQTDVVKHPCCADAQKPSQKENVEGKISTRLPVSEFVINALKSSTINEEELRKTVLDKTEPKKHEVIPEWERELQEELEEYDVLADAEIHDEAWDREIEEMLNEEL
ncbi:synapse-associated protein 1-like isoform X3 [Gambusia affinis]|uniref:synapse-associated protein 1-like isoform X3 n=1 Tax=Gambusia affinis TaxID=33528 RepID=UPI001CDD3668|nr:synapse-associated protein 1-like isoform X3 [Gambusia affinis]